MSEATQDIYVALRDLILAAKMLHANAVGCAQDHYGEDFSIHGLPGWLVDTQADIDKASAALKRARLVHEGAV